MLKHIEMGACPDAEKYYLTHAMYHVPELQGCMYETARSIVDRNGANVEFQHWKPYFCRGCLRDCGTLSGLFEHIENSKTCPMGMNDSHVRLLREALKNECS